MKHSDYEALMVIGLFVVSAALYAWVIWSRHKNPEVNPRPRRKRVK